MESLMNSMTEISITENVSKLNKINVSGPYNLREIVDSNGRAFFFLLPFF